MQLFSLIDYSRSDVLSIKRRLEPMLTKYQNGRLRIITSVPLSRLADPNQFSGQTKDHCYTASAPVVIAGPGKDPAADNPEIYVNVVLLDKLDPNLNLTRTILKRAEICWTETFLTASELQIEKEIRNILLGDYWRDGQPALVTRGQATASESLRKMFELYSRFDFFNGNYTLQEETAMHALIATAPQDTANQEMAKRCSGSDCLGAVQTFLEKAEYLKKTSFDFVLFARPKSNDKDLARHNKWIPVLAIEFDGSSHEQDKKKINDARKNEICREAGLPLMRIGHTSLPQEPDARKPKSGWPLSNLPFDFLHHVVLRFGRLLEERDEEIRKTQKFSDHILSQKTRYPNESMVKLFERVLEDEWDQVDPTDNPWFDQCSALNDLTKERTGAEANVNVEYDKRRGYRGVLKISTSPTQYRYSDWLNPFLISTSGIHPVPLVEEFLKSWMVDDYFAASGLARHA